MMAAMKQQVSSVLFVKDTDGCVFGAFGDECWAVGPKFRGD